MFQFKVEPDIPLLTVTRTGVWSLSTVVSYESALRRELSKLQGGGRTTSFIIDIRPSGAQPPAVADALRAMVARLGPLAADRTAVVTAYGLAKLQAKWIADANTEIFTSMVLARDWVKGDAAPASAVKPIHGTPSAVKTEGSTVHVQGPSEVDIVFTPAAALETANRMAAAATDAQVKASTAPPKRHHFG